MRKNFVPFLFVSLFLLSIILETQLVTLASANPEEIHEPVYSGIAEYYDNRKAVVTVTADDWDSYPSNWQGFEDMAIMLSAKHIYFTGGIITDVNRETGASPDWMQIQRWLDQGYLEAASHSRTHPHVPYGDYDYQIGRSKEDIIGNLTLLPFFSFSSNEYVYTWIEPYGESDGTVRQKLGFYKYLADRDTSYDNFYATWDSTNGLFNRIGLSVGLDGNTDPVSLNKIFDNVYNAGGIYHFYCHPRNIDWRPNQCADLHTSYISGRLDVWYVNFGLLYLYRWIATQNIVQITSTGSGQDKVFKISISSIDRQNYGVRYPVTYVFDIPSDWTTGYVYYRYRESDPWVLMENKSLTDFFNGVDASRFDFTSHKAYVSVGFSDVSNDIYLQIRAPYTPIVHDIAITRVTASPANVKVGQTVSIAVEAKNEGTVSETFDVRVYYDTKLIETRTGVSLDAGAMTTLSFTWHTTGIAEGTYIIKAEASTVAGEQDVADNTYTDGQVIVVAKKPPVASFAYSPIEPVKGEVVTFDASSSYDSDGTIQSYSWNLGDGTSDSGMIVTHAYSAEGTYTVTLTVTDNDALTGSATAYVTVAVSPPPPPPPPRRGPPPNQRPRADFTYSPSAPTDLDTIQFEDESRDPDGSIASWWWDFGDGSNSTEKNPTHQYADDGNYTATLTVRDNDGARGEITKEITVLNVPPKADLTIISPPKPHQPTPQDITQFMDQSFDPDGSIVSWRWEFGDGTISTDQNPTHKYEALGTYTIKLTVTDDDGATDTASKIYDSLPPTSVNDYDGLWHTEDFTITLTTTDDYSGVQAIYYRINEDPTKSVQADGQPHITAEGNNKLQYWSVDGAGNEETHHIIDVKLDKKAPVADAGGDRSVAQNILVTFDASQSSDNVGIISYEWDFGDGSKGTGLTATHTYKEPETYVVRLTVKDAANNKNTNSVSITVLKDTDGDGTPDTTDIDDDGDGMPDKWELSYGLDPLDATDAALDPDGDGLPNLKEYQQGTDPTSYFSPFPWWIIVVAAAFGAILIIAYAIALTFPAKSESP